MSTYIVVKPGTVRPFLASHPSHATETWSAEYPSAFKFASKALAGRAAAAIRGLVYSTDGYERGDFPVLNYAPDSAFK